MCKDIESQKPDGWGFDKGKNEMEIYAKNLNKAIKKLEFNEKLQNVKDKKEE